LAVRESETPDGGGIARILIIDDHPVVRHGLRQLVSNEPDMVVCGEASGTSDALDQVDATHPDLALVDISLPDGSGIDLIKRLNGRDARVLSLVVSMHDEVLYAERALAAGAMGFVNKQEATNTLTDAIRQVLSGQIYLSPFMRQHMTDRPGEAEPAAAVPESRLSDRELEVFELIGRGKTTRDIATTLNLSVKTIETHRVNIKRKLGLDTNTALIRQAVQWTLRGD